MRTLLCWLVLSVPLWAMKPVFGLLLALLMIWTTGSAAASLDRLAVFHQDLDGAVHGVIKLQYLGVGQPGRLPHKRVNVISTGYGGQFTIVNSTGPQSLGVDFVTMGLTRKSHAFNKPNFVQPVLCNLLDFQDLLVGGVDFDRSVIRINGHLGDIDPLPATQNHDVFVSASGVDQFRESLVKLVCRHKTEGAATARQVRLAEPKATPTVTRPKPPTRSDRHKIGRDSRCSFCGPGDPLGDHRVFALLRSLQGSWFAKSVYHTAAALPQAGNLARSVNRGLSLTFLGSGYFQGGFRA